MEFLAFCSGVLLYIAIKKVHNPILKISLLIFILGCFTSSLTGDMELYGIGLCCAIGFFVFVYLFKGLKAAHHAVIGEKSTKIIDQNEEQKLKEDWEHFIKTTNEVKGFRGFFIGLALGFSMSIVYIISIPLKFIDNSWKCHPRYHTKLFSTLFIIFSFGLSIGINIGAREIVNDLGNSNIDNIDVNNNTDVITSKNDLTSVNENDIVVHNPQGTATDAINLADNSADKFQEHESVIRESPEITTKASATNDIQSDNIVEKSSDIILTNSDGSTLVKFNSQNGILYTENGREIAHLVNNTLVVTNGRIIASYNPDTNLFYDEFKQPIDVKIDDTTFQHVKDVKGNGIEIINGEIFDAKTHEKIGTINKIKKV